MIDGGTGKFTGKVVCVENSSFNSTFVTSCAGTPVLDIMHATSNASDTALSAAAPNHISLDAHFCDSFLPPAALKLELSLAKTTCKSAPLRASPAAPNTAQVNLAEQIIVQALLFCICPWTLIPPTAWAMSEEQASNGGWWQYNQDRASRGLPAEKLDKDDPRHVTIITEYAQQHAQRHANLE